MANYTSQAKSSPHPIFINDVLLEHSCSHLYKDCLWLFWPCTSRTESLGQTVQSLGSLPSAPLQKKFANLWSRITHTVQIKIYEYKRLQHTLVHNQTIQKSFKFKQYNLENKRNTNCKLVSIYLGMFLNCSSTILLCCCCCLQTIHSAFAPKTISKNQKTVHSYIQGKLKEGREGEGKEWQRETPQMFPFFCLLSLICFFKFQY